MAERSPNRNRTHKSVVHITGNAGPPNDKQLNRVASTTAAAAAAAAAANRRYITPNVNSVSSHNRLTVTTDRQYEKAHSLDTEYDKYANNVRLNFDKSHSLDESFGGEVAKPKKYVEHTNYPPPPPPPANHSGSPQKYGGRLYEPDGGMYERMRQSMLYSPLMYKRDQQPTHHVRIGARDQSAANLGVEPIYRTMAKSFDHLQSAIGGHQYGAAAAAAESRSPTKRMAKLPATASPSSDYEYNASDFNVDYDMRRNVNNDRVGFYGGQNPDTMSFASSQRRRDAKKVPNKTTIAATLSPSAATKRYLRK